MQREIHFFFREPDQLSPVKEVRDVNSAREPTIGAQFLAFLNHEEATKYLRSSFQSRLDVNVISNLPAWKIKNSRMLVVMLLLPAGKSPVIRAR